MTSETRRALALICFVPLWCQPVLACAELVQIRTLDQLGTRPDLLFLACNGLVATLFGTGVLAPRPLRSAILLCGVLLAVGWIGGGIDDGIQQLSAVYTVDGEPRGTAHRIPNGQIVQRLLPVLHMVGFALTPSAVAFRSPRVCGAAVVALMVVEAVWLWGAWPRLSGIGLFLVAAHPLALVGGLLGSTLLLGWNPSSSIDSTGIGGGID